MLPALLLAAAAAVSAAAEPVRAIELVQGGDYRVNGLPARTAGFGDFKEVLVHPQDPELVVKVFYNKYGPSIPEKRLEAANIARLAEVNAAPPLVEQGATMVAGKPAGYLVQERVMGTTLERPTPAKLAYVRELFERLAKARIELGDTATDFKLKQNLMVGKTRSGGWGAWVVDADLQDSRKSPAELRAFYDELFARLQRR